MSCIYACMHRDICIGHPAPYNAYVIALAILISHYSSFAINNLFPILCFKWLPVLIIDDRLVLGVCLFLFSILWYPQYFGMLADKQTMLPIWCVGYPSCLKVIYFYSIHPIVNIFFPILHTIFPIGFIWLSNSKTN